MTKQEVYKVLKEGAVSLPMDKRAEFFSQVREDAKSSDSETMEIVFAMLYKIESELQGTLS